MQINKDLILNLEKLARLSLSDTERTHLSKDLENILTMVEKLNSLNTDGVEPLVYINDVHNVFRKDEIANQLPVAVALQNAPVKDEHYFKVPKFVD